jgi:hypothetical protein
LTQIDNQNKKGYYPIQTAYPVFGIGAYENPGVMSNKILFFQGIINKLSYFAHIFGLSDSSVYGTKEI